MKLKIILILFLVIKLMKCLSYSDFCIPNENDKIECGGIYNYACGDFVCAKNQYRCHLLSLFSGSKGKHRYNYESFVNKIHQCPESHLLKRKPKYIWSPNDVCLNPKDCVQSLFHRLWLPRWTMKFGECKCSGKYSHKCSSDYCGLDERSCTELSKKPTGIKKCIN